MTRIYYFSSIYLTYIVEALQKKQTMGVLQGHKEAPASRMPHAIQQCTTAKFQGTFCWQKRQFIFQLLCIDIEYATQFQKSSESSMTGQWGHSAVQSLSWISGRQMQIIAKHFWTRSAPTEPFVKLTRACVRACVQFNDVTWHDGNFELRKRLIGQRREKSAEGAGHCKVNDGLYWDGRADGQTGGQV